MACKYRLGKNTNVKSAEEAGAVGALIRKGTGGASARHRVIRKEMESYFRLQLVIVYCFDKFLVGKFGNTENFCNFVSKNSRDEFGVIDRAGM